MVGITTNAKSDPGCGSLEPSMGYGNSMMNTLGKGRHELRKRKRDPMLRQAAARLPECILSHDLLKMQISRWSKVRLIGRPHASSGRLQVDLFGWREKTSTRLDPTRLDLAHGIVYGSQPLGGADAVRPVRLGTEAGSVLDTAEMKTEREPAQVKAMPSRAQRRSKNIPQWGQLYCLCT